MRDLCVVWTISYTMLIFWGIRKSSFIFEKQSLLGLFRKMFATKTWSFRFLCRNDILAVYTFTYYTCARQGIEAIFLTFENFFILLPNLPVSLNCLMRFSAAIITFEFYSKLKIALFVNFIYMYRSNWNIVTFCTCGRSNVWCCLFVCPSVSLWAKLLK